MAEKLEPITLHLEPHQIEALRRMAEKNDRSVSWVARQALDRSGLYRVRTQSRSAPKRRGEPT